tara:strand:- start:349 stop:750 length:402 start_codon:yes stop_codon:yes gene_type:complete
MNIFPKVKRCPSCNSINLIRINGIVYENKFVSLSEWKLKKKFNCRKCKVELGLFINNSDQLEKLVWIDYFKCEEGHLNKLIKLQKHKMKYRESAKKKEYVKVITEIQTIQNQIRLDQAKVKIKVKMQNLGLLN